MKSIKKLLLITVIAVMTVTLTACNDKTSSQSASTDKTNTTETTTAETFPKFKGKDFDGNDVDESLFSKNEVTLINFWFNGCAACVNEMPALEEFNKKLRENGAELIGINVEANDEATLKAAKEILSKQGATYRNITINEGQEAKNYLGKIFSFPTTIMVDKNGNIIGEPIIGNIEDEKRQEEILKVINEVKSGNGVSSSVSSEESSTGSINDELTELYTKENEVFSGNQEIWNKIFANIAKDKIEQNSDMPYAEFLKSQIEASKDSFTADELKALEEDLKKIEEIENQIQELTKSN